MKRKANKRETFNTKAEIQVVTFLEDPRKPSPKPQNPVAWGAEPQEPQRRGSRQAVPKQPCSGPWSTAAWPTAHPGEEPRPSPGAGRLLGPHLDDRRGRRVVLGEEETEGPSGASLSHTEESPEEGGRGNKCQATKQTAKCI